MNKIKESCNYHLQSTCKNCFYCIRYTKDNQIAKNNENGRYCCKYLTDQNNGVRVPIEFNYVCDSWKETK